MNINLEYYKFFYYTAKTGSVTQAAEELSVSQPAVSQVLKQLEHAIGSTLFVRTGKGIRLTPEGETLYSYVKRGYENILQGERKIREIQELDAGEIRIGASDMTLKYCLLPYLEKFHETYPNVKLSVTNGPTPETLRFMQEGKIDFGLVTEPVNVREEIEVHPVRKIRDVFVAGDKFLELKNRLVDPKELEQLPGILLEKNTSTRRYIDQIMKESGVAIHPEIELATSDMIVQFARRNLGIAGVVYDFARECLENGELFELEMPVKIPERSICIVVERKQPLSNAAQKLFNMIMEKE